MCEEFSFLLLFVCPSVCLLFISFNLQTQIPISQPKTRKTGVHVLGDAWIRHWEQFEMFLFVNLEMCRSKVLFKYFWKRSILKVKTVF